MTDHKPIKRGRFGRPPAKAPCIECPLSRQAKPGALGGYTVQQYLDVLHGIADLACHLSPGFKAKRPEDQRSCTGVAMYRANVGGIFLSVNAREAVERVGANADLAFASAAEFRAHHLPPHEILRRDLKAMSVSFRAMGADPGAWLMAEFVAHEGFGCIAQALPAGYQQAAPKQCYANAARLVHRLRDLSYCEGYVIADHLPLPVHHAWAIDAGQRVIDVTLREPEKHVYLGVTVPLADYDRVTRTTKRNLRPSSTSVFLDEIGCVRWAYLYERCKAAGWIPVVLR